jgi:catechol 2,3-dioxygenase-like lactoylglutathione lyase family enzyme
MKFHSTVLFVSSIEQSKVFYTQQLGFTIEHNFGKNVIFKQGLTLWEIQPSHSIVRQLKTNAVANPFELYFEETKIEPLFSKLQAAGVRFFQGIHEEPWGQRTFRFFDPDGHLIEVGEPLEVFVQNLNENGLTAPEISQKSGIPINTVNKILELKEYKMGPSLIAPCGMNCALCLAFLRDKNKCCGCWGDNKGKPYHCTICAIKNCDELKSAKSNFCFDCPKYPCKRLKQLDKRYREKYKMSMVANLDYIKADGIEKFVKTEIERWTCTSCGHVVCVHRGHCLNCQEQAN